MSESESKSEINLQDSEVVEHPGAIEEDQDDRLRNTEVVLSEDKEEKSALELVPEITINDIEHSPEVARVEEIAGPISEETGPASENVEADGEEKYTVLKDQRIQDILELKNEMTALIGNIRDTQRVCERYGHNNQYLQDYVGSLMASGEMGN